MSTKLRNVFFASVRGFAWLGVTMRDYAWHDVILRNNPKIILRTKKGAGSRVKT